VPGSSSTHISAPLAAAPSQQQPTSLHNPASRTVNQLLGLSNNKYLHHLPDNEAFVKLIDCFRMRVEDEFVFGLKNIGIYNNEDPLPVFKEFLDLAESRPGLLPTWWNREKRRECERLAVDSSQWGDINRSVSKASIQEHYRDSMMPMLLRVLGEKIYGKGYM